uniref:TOG domain-containing protein n=1 Tax=Arcella intermedia TaxID=1963864 RepID=A0A6B2L0B2_9EUKA
MAIGFEQSSTLLIPALESMAYDPDITIRLAVAKSLGSFSVYLIQENSEMDLNQIFDILFKCLSDKGNEVKDAAVVSLISIAELLGSEKIEEILIPRINELMENDYEEDCRALAILLLNKLAPVMGPMLTRQHTLPVLENFTNDPVFRVRVAFVTSMNSLFKIIGMEDTTSILLPLYLKLSKDEIWTVRKSCAGMIAEISAFVSEEIRCQELTPLFHYFSTDSSRWVRAAALSAFGPFIVSFPKPLPADDENFNKLISYFCNLANTTDADVADSENQVFCAFNFPAVLSTFGVKYWPLLQPTYEGLSQNLQWKVRRSLAYSLHEVAAILGNEISEVTLVPIFETFLKDLDEVKVGVIKYLAKFLSVLSMERRKTYTYVLEDLLQPPLNWRFRKLIGKQIGDLACIYDDKTISNEIMPIVYSLISDPVARVRRAALPQIGKVIVSLESNTEKRTELLEKIQKLSTSDSYQNRLVFAKICSSAVSVVSNEIFSNYFLKEILLFAQDKVPNIRVVAAEALLQVSKNEHFSQDPQVLETIDLLSKDTDQDVLIVLKVTNAPYNFEPKVPMPPSTSVNV